MRLLKTIFFILSIFLWNHMLFAENIRVDRIDPPNWWVGMKWNSVQLMLYGKNLDQISAQFDNENIVIEKIYQISNNSYAFIDITIPEELSPGNYKLKLKRKGIEQEIVFPILHREKSNGRCQGFDNTDIIYLITPDRFVNGDISNDNVQGMRDWVDRDDILRRHGGDVQGIIDKLDYIKDLGFTTIWINPLIENDMDISYHGYAATDLYKIDPRFGTIQLYQELVNKAHQKGLKILMDHVSNHVGMYHPWVNNPPSDDWFHGSIESHVEAYHDKKVLLDIHGDSVLQNQIANGWFVKEMPDLNQNNIFLKNYLIQNSLWWIEFTGLDGIREDTYPYVNQQFLSDWAKTIFEEYPRFNIVGEVWIYDPIYLSAFQENSNTSRMNTYLPSVTDYGLFNALGGILNRNESIKKIYDVLSKDFVFSNPNMLVTFVDNHDVWRLWDLVNGDINKYKMALTILLTTRGIPQIFYGTEIGLPGGDDHGLIRRDFPGGFPGDTRNAFIESDRTEIENEIFNHIKKLNYLRKKYKSLTKGKLIHFPPKNEIYAYLRELKDEKILVIVNNNEKEIKVDIKGYIRYISKNDSLINIINNQKYFQKSYNFLEIKKYHVLILLNITL